MDGGLNIAEKVYASLFVLTERIFNLLREVHQTKPQVAAVAKHRICLAMRMIFLKAIVTIYKIFFFFLFFLK